MATRVRTTMSVVWIGAIESNETTSHACIDAVQPIQYSRPRARTAGIAQEDGRRKEAGPLHQVEHQQAPRDPAAVALEDGVLLLRPARHMLARLLQHDGPVEGERGDARQHKAGEEEEEGEAVGGGPFDAGAEDPVEDPGC